MHASLETQPGARGTSNALTRTLTRPLHAALLAGLLNFATCYLREFLIPNVPLVLWGDNLGFFNNGSRILQGQLPYRDYFQFLPPGTDLVYAALIKIFGFRIWIPSLTMACLAALAGFLLTLIAARCLKGPIIGWPGLLLAGLVLTICTDATHHWFSTVAILGALLVLIDGTGMRRVAGSGALCGVAACFTQSKGAAALAAFVVYLAVFAAATPEGERSTRAYRARKCFALVAAAAVVFAAVNGYFLWIAGLRRWLYCLVTYPLFYYSAPSINNWRVLLVDLPVHRLEASLVCYPFVYAAVPWVYVFFFATWRRWKRSSGDEWNRIVLVALTGFAIFLAVAASPSPKRVGALSAPVLVLLAWLLRRPSKVNRTVKYALAAAAGFFVVALPLHVQIHRGPMLDLPSGRVAFPKPDLYPEYSWLLRNTHPGEYSFGLPPLYSAFHLLNPGAVDGLDSSVYSRPEQITGLIDDLERHPVPMFVLRQPEVYFWVSRTPDDPLGPVRAYIRANYKRTKTFATGDEIWSRITPYPAGVQ
jgi:hypothetical protein